LLFTGIPSVVKEHFRQHPNSVLHLADIVALMSTGKIKRAIPSQIKSILYILIQGILDDNFLKALTKKLKQILQSNKCQITH
jgi:predicted AlkP superfamily phosphohydrolase/phosphomutase